MEELPAAGPTLAIERPPNEGARRCLSQPLPPRSPPPFPCPPPPVAPSHPASSALCPRGSRTVIYSAVTLCQ